jgi:serine/threonine protein phosphatase PrpC
LSSNIQVAALSDVGCVRNNNEDNFGYDPGNDLYVVCDGMGGQAAGEVASSIACSTVIDVFASHPGNARLEERLALAVHAANDAVRNSSQIESHHGMGTTLVAAAFLDNKVLIGNVGDSRAYLLNGQTCRQLTLDHSYVNELVRSGSIKLEDVPNLDLDEYASVITRAIGAAPQIEPDFFFVDLQDGDTILLASDGLTRYVAAPRILELVDSANLMDSCHKLIDEAKSLGGIDNVTCLLLRFVASAEKQQSVEPESAETPQAVAVEALPPTPPESTEAASAAPAE